MTTCEAISKAREFIISQKDNKGLWRDFNSRNHGNGLDWVSSYVGLALLHSGTTLSDLEQTANSISKRQNEYGGWGYNNETSGPDADSTAFSILFLSGLGYEKEVERAKEFLLQHQRDNGGFGTYIEELVRQDYKGRISPDMSVDGWCCAIPEITAMALQVIPDNERAVQYMKQSQDTEGFWRSYWYNSDIYATSQGIISLQRHGAEKEMKKAQEWLAGQGSKSMFYSAFLIKGLAGNKKYQDKINIEISKLLKLQKEDGSWETLPILQVPWFSNLSPWKDSHRWRGDIKDQNRIFTTATCLETLFGYQEQQKMQN